jgi:hypothetical protein
VNTKWITGLKRITTTDLQLLAVSGNKHLITFFNILKESGNGVEIGEKWVINMLIEQKKLLSSISRLIIHHISQTLSSTSKATSFLLQEVHQSKSNFLFFLI